VLKIGDSVESHVTLLRNALQSIFECLGPNSGLPLRLPLPFVAARLKMPSRYEKSRVCSGNVGIWMSILSLKLTMINSEVSSWRQTSVIIFTEDHCLHNCRLGKVRPHFHSNLLKSWGESNPRREQPRGPAAGTGITQGPYFAEETPYP
jgi:hypothetical protein